MNTIRLTLGLLATVALAQNVAAQENILAEKEVFTLGPAKTWVSGTGLDYTFATDDLVKLTQVPENTSNIFLFPEDQNGGGYNTDANKEIGIQGFYVDLGESAAIGTVTTTWEGAAAQAYDIYLTEEEPTLDILSTTPVYSASNLGQYKDNTAVLPENSTGRYLVFQPTEAYNWGWGVKIRSISATPYVPSVLTSVTTTPSIVLPGVETPVEFKDLNQFGLPIEKAEFSISDNATYENGNITINSGAFATVTASYNGVEVETIIYAAVEAPELPGASNISGPIFTNTDTEDNDAIFWTVAYNGGAVNKGEVTFENGEVAWMFYNTRCVFFSNDVTTPYKDIEGKAWNNLKINPEEEGYTALVMDIFAGSDAEGSLQFEGAQSTTGFQNVQPISVEAGKWNHIIIDLEGVTNISNMSVRFNEQNMCDVLLSNIYFSKEVKSNVAELEEDAAALEVYNLQGIRVAAESIDALPAGLYIINGKKTVIR
ncbi:MAG: hypothetical protein HDR95_00850 [Bacteroides sp.]|nr:hypothetical protein [Bacteroides sp.]